MAANMWKNCLKNVESDSNKILYENLLDFVLQRNGTYFLNKRRKFGCIICIISLLYIGYRVFPGGRGGRGVGLTPHPI